MGRPPKVAPPPVTMTPAEIRAARETLGHMWGLGQAVNGRDFADILRVSHGYVARCETGKAKPHPLLCVCIRMMLAGAHPPDMLKILRL